jgi:sterol desaturase/sphingolipid hydroxylase (fatty acid hydroxylase superfamily)
MNELAQKATQILGQLQALSPKAASMSLLAVQMDAISTAIWGLFGLVGLIVLQWVWRKHYWPWTKNGDLDDEFPQVLAGIGLGIAMLICGGIAMGCLLDSWTWIAMVHPELYLAHRLIG